VQVKPEEVAALVKGFKDTTELFSKGLHIAGDKYVVIKADDQEIRSKKVRPFLDLCEGVVGGWWVTLCP
jgi:hypothetical protein